MLKDFYTMNEGFRGHEKQYVLLYNPAIPAGVFNDIHCNVNQ